MANVLLLDKDTRRARLATWVLEPYHAVDTRHTLQAVADHVPEINPDVIIYSTQLYEGDQSGEILRALTKGPNEPPRVLAIEDRGALPARTIPAPVDAVISSPFDAEDLFATLNTVLGKPYR